MVRRFAFAVPGDLATPTGGYAYDRRMIAELARSRLGDRSHRSRRRLSLARAKRHAPAARTRLLAMPAGRSIVVDGLALGVLPEAASQACRP